MIVLPTASRSNRQPLRAAMDRLVVRAGIALVAAAALGLLPGVHGQSTPQPPQAVNPVPNAPAASPAQAAIAGQENEVPPEPTISTHVDEVSLDLVVHDKRRKPVLDLTADQLAVADNGVPVKLDGLHLVKGEAAHGHLVTLVFDQFVGPMAKQARNTAAKVLEILPKDGYSIAVLNFGGRLRLMQDFTSNRDAVWQAIRVITESNAVQLTTTLSQEVSITTDKAESARVAYSKQAETDLIAEAQRGSDSAGHNVDEADRAHATILLNALQDAQKLSQEQNTYRTLSGLQALVKAQQRAPERKAIIYFTQNRQMDSSAKATIKAIAAAATKANVTIYTVDLDAMNDSGQYELPNATFNAKSPFNPAPIVVDPHGDTMIPMQQQSGMPIAGTPSPTGPQWGPQQDIAVMTDFHRFSGDYAMFEGKRSPMVDLAQGSGGIYIDVQSNLKRSLKEMAEDLSTYYEATYKPPIKDYDGSFRTISVKPLRKNLYIESKAGYYALPPGAEAGLRPFELPLLKLLDQKILPADVPFKAKVLSFGEMPDGPMSTLVVEVPIHGLQVKEDVHTDLFSAHVAVEARVRDSKGVQVERVGEDIAKRGALETLDRDKTVSIVLQRHFICAPGHYTMDVAVADQDSGKTGAQRVDFDVPDPARAEWLSDLVLVRKVDGIRAEDDDPVEPLRYENSKITPNISGELPQDAKGVQLFFILHPNPASKEDPTLEMQVIHNGTPGRRTPLPLRMAAAGMPVPYLASFGSNALAPGKYQVVAYLEQDGKTTVRETTFTVDGTVNAQTTALAAAASEAAGLHATQTVIEERHAPGQLSIVPVTNPVAPMSPADARQLIEDARDNALHYDQSLPNFICLQVTNRSFDTSGYGRWKLRDSMVELLRYRDKQETRTTIEVNGESSSANRAGMKGSLSTGEFGGVLRAIFSDSAKANFTWKETDALNNGTVQVFDYQVEQKNSMFSVVGSNDKQIFAAFHGQVFIDSATRHVRRLTLIADGLPRNFPTHATRIDVDYDYVAINDHDYLVPVSAEMRLLQGKHEAVLNTIEFRNYRRYGSNMKILGFKPVGD